KAAVAEVAPVIEDRGIDEIYIDLTDVPGVRDAVGHDPLGGVKAVAREIKNSVWRATGLTCSIGVTPNKLLSKIASELDKPDGITVLTMDDIPKQVWPLGVRKINGIGPKAGEKLIKLGLTTVGDIAAADPRWLVEQFGDSYGHWLHNASHGRDARPVVTHSEPVSVSRETTFERDLSAVHDKALLGQIMDELCERLAGDLSAKRYAGKTVGIKLRFEGFVTVTRDQTLKTPITSAADIRHAVGLCLKRVKFDKRLRLMGVRIGNLVHASEVPPPAAAVEKAKEPERENLSLF
ncbi:MAG TPA: DNA polymerase IV, partial [Roseateles sp.]